MDDNFISGTDPVFAWDLDGTVIDTEFRISEITTEVIRPYGIELEVEDAFALFGGKSFTDRFNSIAARAGVELSDEQLAAIRKIYNARKDAFYEGPDLAGVPGAALTLQNLEKQGYVLGITSSNAASRSRQALLRTGLSEYFGQRIYGPECAGGNKKPHPGIHNAFILESGVRRPDQVIVVDDSTPGVVAGRAAGAFVVAYMDPRTPNQVMKRQEFYRAGANMVITGYRPGIDNHSGQAFEDAVIPAWSAWRSWRRQQEQAEVVPALAA